mgnify:CR=1 FL=1
MQASKRLANEFKPTWKVAIERLANQIDSNLKKLANATSNRFDRAEERLDELASHFGTIQDQLYVLCEVISSNDMQNDPSMNGGNVVCKNGLHFDENDASSLCFNEKVSISHDCIYGSNVQPQEMSMNDSHLTPLEKCFEEVSFKAPKKDMWTFLWTILKWCS